MIVAISIYLIASIFALILISTDGDGFDHPVLDVIIFILTLPFTLAVVVLALLAVLITELVAWIKR